MGWRFEWRRSWPDVWAEDFRQVWDDLVTGNRLAHVYHRPDVVRAWADTRGRAIGAQPMVGFAWDSTGAKVLLPWVVVPHRGRIFQRRVLEPAGQSLFGYHDPLVAAPDPEAVDWEEFWAEARRAVKTWCDQALFRFVGSRYAQGPLTVPCSDDSPVLDLRGFADFEALLGVCSRSHRGDVRRQSRRLVQRGAVALWIAGPDNLREALDDLRHRFWPVLQAAWRHEKSHNIFHQPGTLEFLSSAVADGVRAGWAHYAALHVAGSPIAWHLGCLDPQGLYYWIPGYDAAWENFSPGKLLLAMLIEHGIGQRWSRIHFLTGAQPYKLAWQPTKVDLRTVRWHAPTLRGAVLAQWDALHRRASSSLT